MIWIGAVAGCLPCDKLLLWGGRWRADRVASCGQPGIEILSKKGWQFFREGDETAKIFFVSQACFGSFLPVCLRGPRLTVEFWSGFCFVGRCS